MLILFTKGAGGRPDVLTCRRNDGSVTWAPVGAGVGAVHDLIHYTVETTLGIHNAFFGMVADGRNIGDFGSANGVRDVYPPEALFVEAIVGFLQMERVSGGAFTADEFSDMLARQFPSLMPLGAGITPEVLARLRAATEALLARWESMAEEERLELRFAAMQATCEWKMNDL